MMTLDILIKVGFGAVTVALAFQIAVVALLATANLRRKRLVEPIAWLILGVLIEVAGLAVKLRLDVAMSSIMLCIVFSRRHVNFQIKSRGTVKERLRALKIFEV